jgi:pimeloyl-ACP methyl ester carboxylesterase
MKRLRGLRNLVHDAVEVTTDLVERTHESVASKYVGLLRTVDPIAPQVETVDTVRRAITAGVFGAVRTVNEGVRQIGNAGHDAVAAGIASSTGSDTPDANMASSASGNAPDVDAPTALDTASGADGPDTSMPDAPVSPASDPAWPRLMDTAQGALNGLFGDFLQSRDNELAFSMELRHRDRALVPEREALASAFPTATGKLAVFVHGLGCTERAWWVGGERFWGDAATAFGALLERDLGYTPLYVRYNTGLHVSQNGRALSALLDEVVAAFPAPVTEIVLVGHSMGGLVSRSAAHYGAEDARAWIPRLRHVFCLGSPHQGAPLEQATHLLSSVLRVFDTPGTQVPAAVLEARSAGVRDMRHGHVIDEGWHDADPEAWFEHSRREAPFLDGVAYYYVASTVTSDPGDPLGQFVGDLLLRPASASGHAAEPARRVPFPVGRVFGGMNHFDLTNHPDVYAQLRQWLTPKAQ